MQHLDTVKRENKDLAEKIKDLFNQLDDDSKFEPQMH